MRLINADKLTTDVCLATALDKAESFYAYFYSQRQIDNAPTVEAIPIEWIEEWGRKNGMSESMSLRVMIEDWEKENADT